MITRRQAKQIKHLAHEMAQSFALVAAAHAGGRGYHVLSRRIYRKKMTALQLEDFLDSLTEKEPCQDPTDSSPTK